LASDSQARIYWPRIMQKGVEMGMKDEMQGKKFSDDAFLFAGTR
jgi:hypothetical protein